MENLRQLDKDLYVTTDKKYIITRILFSNWRVYILKDYGLEFCKSFKDFDDAKKYIKTNNK